MSNQKDKNLFDIEVCERNGNGDITIRNRFNDSNLKTAVEMVRKWFIKKDITIFQDEKYVSIYNIPELNNARKQAEISFCQYLEYRCKKGF